MKVRSIFKAVLILSLFGMSCSSDQKVNRSNGDQSKDNESDEAYKYGLTLTDSPSYLKKAKISYEFKESSDLRAKGNQTLVYEGEVSLLGDFSDYDLDTQWLPKMFYELEIGEKLKDLGTISFDGSLALSKKDQDYLRSFTYLNDETRRDYTTDHGVEIEVSKVDEKKERAYVEISLVDNIPEDSDSDLHLGFADAKLKVTLDLKKPDIQIISVTAKGYLLGEKVSLEFEPWQVK